MTILDTSLPDSLRHIVSHRSDGDRTLLCDLDTAIQRLAVESPGNAVGVQLTGVCDNLLRRWAEM